MNEYAREILFWIAAATFFTLFVIGFRPLFSLMLSLLPDSLSGLKEAAKAN